MTVAQRNALAYLSLGCLFVAYVAVLSYFDRAGGKRRPEAPASHESKSEIYESQIPRTNIFIKRKAVPLQQDPIDLRDSFGVSLFRLEDLDLSFVRLQLTGYKIAMADCKVTNALYEKYLSETGRVRDDSVFLDAEIGRSTGDPAIRIHDRDHLWELGKCRPGTDRHPVTFVSVLEALKFCDWLNRRYLVRGHFRLPIEKEWVFAAYGEDRHFPWGNDPRKLDFHAIENVRSHPELQTPDGILELWGEVSEIVLTSLESHDNPVVFENPYVTLWLGPSLGSPEIGPRKAYWGYTHSVYSRSDARGFRIVYDHLKHKR